LVVKENFMDRYEQFRQILDTHPSGAPRSDAFDEILRLLFSPEDIDIVLHMSFKPMSIEDIARASSLSADEVEEKLESMANRAVIFSHERDGRKSYGLLPTIPGLFEFPFMRGGGTPLHDRLAKLWETYHRECFSEAFSGKPTPFMRVVPVEKSLSLVTRIHPYEDISHLIEETDYLAVTNCACRVSVGKCDAPREVCMIFGGPARFLVERGYAREISKAEAMKILERAEEAGLVHTSNNSADRANLICNCCPCCCTILRGRTELNHPNAFLTSEYEARVDEDRCTGCGTCADERCPVKAIELENDIARVVAERCIGCGLCVTACPSEAIELVERENIPEIPETTQEMGLRIAEEKGKLDDFIKIMKR
jgi:electron transport complex protein RnfB